MISTKKTKTPQPKKRKSGRVSMRGKRVSEAYNGLCPVPHADIPTNSYYSFIDTEVSDPLRMRQLLLWCSLKTAETYPFEDDVEIKKIQQKVIQALANKTLNTSWYHNVFQFD
jgi:hypothetical protein